MTYMTSRAAQHCLAGRMRPMGRRLESPGLWKCEGRETDLKIRDEGKEDHGHSQQIKLNNFKFWTKM